MVPLAGALGANAEAEEAGTSAGDDASEPE
jgi:hypothetical protein